MNHRPGAPPTNAVYTRVTVVMIQSEDSSIYPLRHPKSQKHRVHLCTQSYVHYEVPLRPDLHCTNWPFLTEKQAWNEHLGGPKSGSGRMLCLRIFSREVTSISPVPPLPTQCSDGKWRLCQARKRAKQESWLSDTFRIGFLKIWLNLLVRSYTVVKYLGKSVLHRLRNWMFWIQQICPYVQKGLCFYYQISLGNYCNSRLSWASQIICIICIIWLSC